MLRLSMNQLTTMRWSFEQDVMAIAAAGYTGIGVWRQKLSDVSEDHALELLTQSGLHVSNLLWAGGFTGTDGRKFRESVRDAQEAIRTAARLQADCLVIYTGSRGIHTKRHAREIVVNALRDLIPFAEEFGVTLAVEPMHPSCGQNWTFLTSLKEGLQLIDPLETPFIKLALDTYHFGLERSSLQILEEIAHRVAIVHLGDAKEHPKGEQNRCPLGQGMLPLRQIVRTLTDAGYVGYWDVELMGESVEWLDYEQVLDDSRRMAESLLHSVA